MRNWLRRAERHARPGGQQAGDDGPGDGGAQQPAPVTAQGGGEAAEGCEHGIQGGHGALGGRL